MNPLSKNALVSLEVGPTFPAATREKVSWHTTEMPPVLAAIKEATGADECVAFCSCERTLILCACSPADLEVVSGRLSRFVGAKMGVAGGNSPATTSGRTVLEALLLRAIGVESAIFGEDQILGQMACCYEVARRNGFTGPVLNRVVQTLVFAARKVKRVNPIGRGRVALAGLAFEEIEKYCAELPEQSVEVCIVGWGPVTKTIARLVATKVPAFRSLTVANRTPEKVDFPCVRIPMHEADACARRSAMVVAMASRIEPILRPPLDGGSFSRGRLLIDLGVPRNIDPSAGEGGDKIFDIDFILRKSARNLEARRASLAPAMVEVEKFVSKMSAFLEDGKATSWRGEPVV